MIRRFSLLASVVALAAGSAEARSLYFVGDETSGRWCVYPVRHAMLDQERRLHERYAKVESDEEPPLVLMGEARLGKDGAIQALSVSGGAHSGDWAVTDSYRLKGGRIVSMRRVVGHADGSRDAILTFQPVGGRLVLKRQNNPSGFVPDWPILSDLRREPYYRGVARAATASVPPQGICGRP